MKRVKPASVAFAALAAYCAGRGYPGPEPEYRFAKPRKWMLDAAFPAHLLGVEFHGGVWTSGRHTRGGGFTRDREKMNEAQLRGWTVLEVTTGQLEAGDLWPMLDRFFAAEGLLP